MRLFITGDTHSDIDTHKLSTKCWPEQKNLTRRDTLIIAGDFGVPWHNPEDATDKYLLDQYESRKFTTAFVDGNHENFDAIASYPVVTWHGAKCHKLRPHVYHIMRGEVLKLGGHKILCIGGADSIDKADRVEGKSWWPQETITMDDINKAVAAMYKTNPDIIVSHDAPYLVTRQMYWDPNFTSSEYALAYFYSWTLHWDELQNNDDGFRAWFFGHHHKDREFTKFPKFHEVFHQVVEVPEKIPDGWQCIKKDSKPDDDEEEN